MAQAPKKAPSPKFRSRLIVGGVITSLGASTVGFVAKWEGLETEAYKDIVGVWTICYGETLNVRPGQTATKKECDEKLIHRIANDFEPEVARCIGYEQAAEAPPGLYLSMVEGAYNYGTGAFCKSTAAVRAAAKDWMGACQALAWFIKAGGKTVKGLVNRRMEAKAICELSIPGVNPKKLTRSRTALEVVPDALKQ